MDRQGSARLAAHRRDRRLRPLRERKLGADGLYHDCYVTADQLERVSEEERPDFVPRGFAGRRPDLRLWQPAEPLPDEELTNRSEDAYAADCAARRAAGVAAFAATDTGFTAKTAYDADELVFFSVPYDDGSVPQSTVSPPRLKRWTTA